MQAQAQEFAFAGHGKLSIVETVGSLAIIRRQVVDTVLHELDWSPGYFGERSCDGDHLADHVLAAEAAAGVHGIEVDLVGGQPQRTSNHPGHEVEHIGIGPDLHALTSRVVLAGCPGRLHRRGGSTWPVQASLYDALGASEVTIHVAKDEGMVIGHV